MWVPQSLDEPKPRDRHLIYQCVGCEAMTDASGAISNMNLR